MVLIDYQNPRKFRARRARENRNRRMTNERRNKAMTKERRAKHDQKMRGQAIGLGRMISAMGKFWNWMTKKEKSKL